MLVQLPNNILIIKSNKNLDEVFAILHEAWKNSGIYKHQTDC